MGYSKEQRDAKKLLEEVEDNTQETVIETVKKVPINNLPLYTTVWVKSNRHGELIYVSKKTGFTTSWENFGIPQPMTLEELMTMRNTYIKFFTRNLIIIEGFQDPEYNETYSVEEILAYLQVTQYYTSSLCPNNLNDVFKMTPEK
jgi:hypothetical protein